MPSLPHGKDVEAFVHAQICRGITLMCNLPVKLVQKLGLEPEGHPTKDETEDKE